MTDRSVVHSSYTIERVYGATPAQVFAAWATPDAKRQWFVDMDSAEWQSLDYGLDFRVGGREHGRFRFGGKGPVHGNDTVYLDIVPDARIVFAYTMSMDERRTSASIVTVELKPDDKGTRLVFTEHGAFLDGLDTAERRKGGWGTLLDHLGVVLQKQV
jgi:uncharacterized protein YndB with AHSA1/START domain